MGTAMTSPRIIASTASSTVTGMAFASATAIGSSVKMEYAGVEAHHLPDPDEVLLVVRQVEPEVARAASAAPSR